MPQVRQKHPDSNAKGKHLFFWVQKMQEQGRDSAKPVLHIMRVRKHCVRAAFAERGKKKGLESKISEVNIQ